MKDDLSLSAIRFGTGLSPSIRLPVGGADMLDRLRMADHVANRFPIPRFEDLLPRLEQIAKRRTAVRMNKGTAVGDEADAQMKILRQRLFKDRLDWLRADLARSVTTEDGFRERLVRFWADHFTVRVRSGEMRYTHASYVEEAIRPHIAGNFADILKAAVMHPMMLVYLDQHVSVGPSTPLATRRGRGLNENLAREVLELHTLGTGGPYRQTDVRELAELFTGLSVRVGQGMIFRPEFAEPGAETVLGQRYGGPDPAWGDIARVLEDLAWHPATARHLARKLATHFVSDAPPDDLVDHMATRFQEEDGDLMALYAAMLNHPAAWDVSLKKAKLPFDFITSALRALGVTEQRLLMLSGKMLRHAVIGPVGRMGQPWQSPPGPDGWPENASDWITPQGLAERIKWAMTMPEQLQSTLPDPRIFLETALGPFEGDALRFAVQGAERSAVGIGVVLASPAFQRR